MSHWQTHLPSNLNSKLMDWLTDRNSMTKRLKAICSVFTVDVMKEYFEVANVAYCKMLDVPNTEKIKFREAYLYCDKKPMIFAESLFPKATLEKINSLDVLNTKPIGEILFSDSSTTRGPLEFKQLMRGDPLYEKAFQKVGLPQFDHNQEGLWARRSVFTIQGEKLLICEIFLFLS